MKVTPGSIMFPDNPPKITTPLTYPQRFKKKNLDNQFTKFLEVFKKLHINILFADTLEHMLNYVKFLKGMMSKKHKVEEFKCHSPTKVIEERERLDLTFLARLVKPYLTMCFVIWALASI